jgi:hypothetical protein
MMHIGEWGGGGCGLAENWLWGAGRIAGCRIPWLWYNEGRETWGEGDGLWFWEEDDRGREDGGGMEDLSLNSEELDGGVGIWVWIELKLGWEGGIGWDEVWLTAVGKIGGGRDADVSSWGDLDSGEWGANTWFSVDAERLGGGGGELWFEEFERDGKGGDLLFWGGASELGAMLACLWSSNWVVIDGGAGGPNLVASVPSPWFPISCGVLPQMVPFEFLVCSLCCSTRTWSVSASCEENEKHPVPGKSLAVPSTELVDSEVPVGLSEFPPWSNFQSLVLVVFMFEERNLTPWI